MRRNRHPAINRGVAALTVVALILGALTTAMAVSPVIAKGKPTGGETAGNNLSYPVLWAEGVAKALPGTAGTTPVTTGVWWWQWGTNGSDPDVTPASCPPDPDDNAYCDDGIPGQYDATLLPGSPPADNPLPLVRAYIQKDPLNVWQAGSADVSAEPLSVHWIDWGDNLESNDWYTRSQVRTEVVLFQDLVTPMTEYEMRHTSGWGIDEVHGLAVDGNGPVMGPGTRATVYTHCARLTIQKLLVDRADTRLADLVWVPGEGWTEPDGYEFDLVNPHIFNGSVHEGGDGPGYYSAEINVKGRIIFGYTWNVRQMNDMTGGTAAGDYRVTFSLDETCGTASLNTYFTEGVTEILVPVEEVVIASDSTDGGGATGVLDYGNNLTYMDVRILERGGGGRKK